MSKWAPDNEDGLHAYVVATRSWGRGTTEIRYAASLKEARAKYGRTSRPLASVSVRRARPEDVQP